MPNPAPPEDHAAIADLERRLRRQDRRIRYTAWAVGLLGFAAVTVGPMWHEWLTAASPAGLRSVIGLLDGLVFLFGPMCLFSLLVRSRGSLLQPAMLTTDPKPQGYATISSPKRGTLAVLILVIGAGWADLIRPAEVGGLRLAAHWPAGLIPVAFAVAIACWALYRSPRVLLLPDRLVVRRWRTRSVPWAQLTAAPARPGAFAYELSVAVDGPGIPGVLRMPLQWHEVDPDFLADVIGHYISCPQDRTAIGSLSELARRRQGYLATRSAATTSAASRALAGQS